jgi:hypothetical protein
LAIGIAWVAWYGASAKAQPAKPITMSLFIDPLRKVLCIDNIMFAEAMKFRSRKKPSLAAQIDRITLAVSGGTKGHRGHHGR